MWTFDQFAETSESPSCCAILVRVVVCLRRSRDGVLSITRITITDSAAFLIEGIMGGGGVGMC